MSCIWMKKILINEQYKVWILFNTTWMQLSVIKCKNQSGDGGADNK